jgi:hypothetical protein
MAKKDIRSYPVPDTRQMGKEEMRKLIQDAVKKSPVTVVPQGRSGKRPKKTEEQEQN